MNQTPTRVPKMVRKRVSGIPDEYVRALPYISSTMLGVLHEAGVDAEYAASYRNARNPFDIVLLWRRGVEPNYALQFSERRDLTVLDIADLWDENIPAEFATVL